MGHGHWCVDTTSQITCGRSDPLWFLLVRNDCHGESHSFAGWILLSHSGTEQGPRLVITIVPEWHDGNQIRSPICSPPFCLCCAEHSPTIPLVSSLWICRNSKVWIPCHVSQV